MTNKEFLRLAISLVVALPASAAIGLAVGLLVLR